MSSELELLSEVSKVWDSWITAGGSFFCSQTSVAPPVRHPRAAARSLRCLCLVSQRGKATTADPLRSCCQGTPGPRLPRSTPVSDQQKHTKTYKNTSKHIQTNPNKSNINKYQQMSITSCHISQAAPRTPRSHFGEHQIHPCQLVQALCGDGKSMDFHLK